MGLDMASEERICQLSPSPDFHLNPTCTSNSSSWEVAAKDQKFKVIFGYSGSFKPSWDSLTHYCETKQTTFHSNENQAWCVGFKVLTVVGVVSCFTEKGIDFFEQIKAFCVGFP